MTDEYVELPWHPAGAVKPLVDICKLHKAAGHQVWVYCQMTGKRNVMPRLKEILSKEGLKVGVMRADDVEPKEREEWIAKHGREYDVMICFPKLVSTGLDMFSKVQGGHSYNCIVFYETGYKLNEMRQAARRAWRIGQPRDCYIYYMYYQGTMQHRAMSLMSKKMAAALALEGEFSEEGLAAMAGDGDDQMALAKSMSEKIDDADKQRSWSKVKSLTEKRKPPKKRPVAAIAALAADAKTDAIDTLEEEAQLLARTVLERQKKLFPASAMPEIISLAERFAKADEGMWGAARAMAFREEAAPVDIAAHIPAEVVARFAELADAMYEDAKELVEATPEWSKPVALFVPSTEDTPKGVLLEEVVFDEPITVKAGETLAATVESNLETTKLRVHKPEPAKKVHAVFDDIEFDDDLIAKMMANIASNGMTLADLGG